MSKQLIFKFLLFCFFAGLQTVSGQVKVIKADFAIDPQNPSNAGKRIIKIEFDHNLVFTGADRVPQYLALALVIKQPDGTETPLGVDRDDVSVFTGGKILNIENLNFDPALATAKSFELTITKLKFLNSNEQFTDDIKVSGNIVNLSTFRDLTLKFQNDEADAAKPTANKNFLAGFNFASSENGATEGSGELITNIALNKINPDLFLNINLKKSSKEDADPKQFNIGFAYRKAFLSPFIKNKLKTAFETSDPDKVLTAVRDIQRKEILLGFLTEVSGRIEGEAMNFNTTNAVFDVMPFQILSRVKRLGSSDVFMKFHIVPAGLELGRNLRTENEAVSKYYITRFKVGGELGFTYEPRNQEKPAIPFVRRAELNVRSIYRHLFRDETAFDPETDEASGISRGGKTYSQFDLKVFFTNTASGRFGFKVSRLRGPLPPTFNDTRAFTYGLIFESAEDKQP